MLDFNLRLQWSEGVEIRSDNDDYRTLSDEIGITPHSMLGGYVASNR